MKKILLGLMMLVTLGYTSSARAHAKDIERKPYVKDFDRPDRPERNPVPDPPGNTPGANCMMNGSSASSGPVLLTTGMLVILLLRRRGAMLCIQFRPRRSTAAPGV